METVPLYLSSPFGNREQATTLLRRVTGLPELAAHSLVLTLDSVSAAVLRTAGVGIGDAWLILAALWQHPERITDTPPHPAPLPTPPPTARQLDADERKGQYLRELGERVHVIRRARRITLTQLRRRSGIEVCVLRDLEDGVAWPSLLMLRRVAAALDVPLTLLVDEKATPLVVLRLLPSLAA